MNELLNEFSAWCDRRFVTTNWGVYNLVWAGIWFGTLLYAGPWMSLLAIGFVILHVILAIAEHGKALEADNDAGS